MVKVMIDRNKGGGTNWSFTKYIFKAKNSNRC